MTHFQSKKWRLFTSRPTPILKRDFIKWTYLSLGEIKGFKLSKILAISDGNEMDVFVDSAEDRKNYAAISKQYKKGEIEKILRFYDSQIAFYEPEGKDDTKRSLNAMKNIAGPAIIYSYYAERFLEPKQNEKKGKLLLELNSKVRDSGAKVVYSLYDKAHDALLKKYKNEEIDWLTINELNQPSGKIATQRRKEFYVFLGTAKESAVYTIETAKKFLTKEKFTELKRNSSKTEVIGLPAGGGTVTGIVKIVRGMKDMENCTGKIVVSRDTIIEYTPMLKKNLAIVTDLGGISCHAVLTAREFKIPCVVGTKYATEVFKDGDWVEVDADKGIVKILKNK